MFDKKIKIDWDLKCSASEASNHLLKAIDEPVWCFSPRFLSGSNYHGKLKNGNFKIWTKSPRRGPPPAVLVGSINPVGEESKIKAEIRVNPLLRFNINPVLTVIIILTAVTSFPISMIGIMTQKSQFLNAFPIFFVSISLVVVIIFRRVALTEIDDLSKFISQQFSSKRRDN